MKGLLLISTGVEDIEAIGTRDLLIRAGFQIDTATFEDSLSLKTSYDLQVQVDLFAKNISVDTYDFLIIPGGPYVKKIVDDDSLIKSLAKEFHRQDKMIAAICAGPRFLGQAGLLKGKNFTAFTGSEKDIQNGIYHPNEKCVVDGQFITASGAGALYEFAFEITAYYFGYDKANFVRNNILY